METFFSSAPSPEVVVVSLKRGSLFELSPVFPRSRYFTRSSIKEVKRHRVRPRTPNLGGTIVVTALKTNDIFAKVQDENKPGKLDGLEVRLLREMSRHLNFSVQYKNMKCMWGFSKLKDCRSGVIQLMKSGKADLVLANIWILEPYITFMDFGPSVNSIKLSFIVRRPEVIAFKWKYIFCMFHPEVWVATLVSFVLIVTVHRVILWWTSRDDIGNFMSSIVTVLGVFLCSSSNRRRNTRLILTSWSLFSMLITTLLSTGIYSRFTLPLYSPRVDSLRQLVEGDYYWTADFQGPLHSDEMKKSVFDFGNQWDTMLEKRYRNMTDVEATLLAGTDKKITFLVQEYGNAVVMLTHNFKNQKALKHFRLVKETIQETHGSFAVQKHSPLLEPLTQITIRIVQAGLMKQWIWQVMNKWPVYDTRSVVENVEATTFSEPRMLLLKNLLPGFYLLLFGLTLASMAFIIEIISSIYLRK